MTILEAFAWEDFVAHRSYFFGMPSHAAGSFSNSRHSIPGSKTLFFWALTRVSLYKKAGSGPGSKSFSIFDRSLVLEFS